MAAAAGSRCTITNVTTLTQSQRDALSLVQAAGTGLEAPSLKVLWARGSRGLVRSSEIEKSSLSSDLQSETDLIKLLDKPRGKSKSDERDEWRAEVCDEIAEIFSRLSVAQEKQVDANCEAVAEAVALSAKGDLRKVTDQLSDTLAQLAKLKLEHRITIDGIESRRRKIIDDFNLRDSELVRIQKKIDECEKCAVEFTRDNIDFFLLNSSCLDVESAEYKQLAGKNKGKEAMDARITQLRSERLQYYGTRAYHKEGKGKDVKSLTQLLPNGVEKSSGYQLGVAAKQFCRDRIETYYPIYHIIERIVDDFDTKTKEHWMPPCKEDNGAVLAWTGEDMYSVDAALIPGMQAASESLYDAWKGTVGEDLCLRFRQQNERGVYSMTDTTFRVPKGDGIMLVFALMTRLHDVHSDHIQDVIAEMHNVWVLFAKGSVLDACTKVRKLIEQCMELGIQMEWQLTGRRIIQVLTGRNAGIATDVRTMMKGPTTDPTSPTSECLSYLEELCTKVERSVAGMQHDLPAAPKAVYKAFMGRLTLIESKMLDQDGLRDRIEETKGRIERSKAEKKRDRKQLTALSANNIAQSDLSECQVVGCDNAAPGRTSFCDTCFNKFKGTKTEIKMKNGATRTLELSGTKKPPQDGKGGKGGKGKGKGKGKGYKGGKGGKGYKGHVMMSARDITDLVEVMRPGWKGEESEPEEEEPEAKRARISNERVIRLEKKLKSAGNQSAAKAIGKLKGKGK